MQSVSNGSNTQSVQLEMENLNPDNQERNESIHSSRFNRCLRSIDSGLGTCKQWIINNPIPASLIGLGLISGSVLGLGLGLGLSTRTITPTPTPTPTPTANTNLINFNICFKKKDSSRVVHIQPAAGNDCNTRCKTNWLEDCKGESVKERAPCLSYYYDNSEPRCITATAHKNSQKEECDLSVYISTDKGNKYHCKTINMSRDKNININITDEKNVNIETV